MNTAKVFARTVPGQDLNPRMLPCPLVGPLLSAPASASHCLMPKSVLSETGPEPAHSLPQEEQVWY